MNNPARISLIVVAVACLAVTAACNDEEEFDESVDKAQLERLEAEIDELIGEANCKEPGECGAIAFGDKPCGGPWSYKIFSTSEVDTTVLFAKVDSYNKFNAVLNERYGWMSDCMMVMRPGIECLEGRCVAIYPSKEVDVE